ncbi:tetratricopeptide repeat protein [Paenibacillus xerothermodurans]|uniref:Uncharacterized protein n=1 Tax=Paenibacillus xerothermodurans TaxID=1977292 RepID=A0A2W1NTB0_PAEXE|nr:hypothetical protein [Paenibacillus xerothermodurans]PZE21913.1 hypothetical protein CBW46_005790 [Paenibacillus xerothermodurans]
MFKHLFASMNEMLDDIVQRYHTASGAEKQELEAQLHTLKTMSDTFIEEWLSFEEKLAGFYQSPDGAATVIDLLDPELAGKRTDEFVRGQGFYQLFMYDEAIQEFSRILLQSPDFTLARIYLAMSYLHKGDMAESYREFHFLSQLTDNSKMKAIAYNALGCIQMLHQNLDKALEYFSLAYQSDPYSVNPLVEMGVCSDKQGKLEYASWPART